ncbi:excitatory amino acid transporter 1-like [Hyla sarda]|uniref:excitatory amino acid transporter 1-like n=1 Tax=Hyla sarda TaxID=327740 RepID=UPI0024C22BAF|nr:excitatory amino acid transporter 1-like [Hyla sarda]XP_056426739.1 excitatory amino acid transporter 1-like [Hyla sarda]XP_056426749.1 excitatory amino acid transporter 1-like [Hyla sarda]XP_056426757.1 excitatory amino acid transporter 1-like [Hyla sarda]XP_056426767.1 excitatory amino acid transporter 1-like [Hyla sarda]XP_056426777.1 excitatory amino acid transporter 1-like [Hyla sarda]
MSEKDGNADNLFLKEDSAKGEKAEGRVHSWQYAMRKRASRTGKQMRKVTLGSVRGFLVRNAFVILTVAAVVLGIGLAFALRPYKMSYRQIKYFSFPGELLMRMLQMLVLPLIVSSLVTGMASLDSKASGKMGMRAVVYYTVTTFIAVFIGIVMVIIIHPGRGSKENMTSQGKIERVQATDAILDLIRNMFPPNLIEACFKQYKTQYQTKVYKIPTPPDQNFTVPTEQPTEAVNISDIMENVTRAMGRLQEMMEIEEVVPVTGSANGVNALGLVVFSMCFGLVIGKMKEQGRALKEFFDCLNEAIMRLVAIIIWYAPIGIMFLISGKILEMDDLLVMGGQLGMYTITVIIGLLIHALVVLPLLFFIVTRRNPWPFIGGLLQALVTALGTSSSSATLPITFRCLEENNRVDKRVTRFVLPVGATINMDGTALYEALAAIFIAQVNNYELNFGQIITISITATAASIGAAGIPQAGLVTMVIVLTSVGLPTEDITLIIAVDWFLDRLRTTTNVLGDSLGAGIVEHLSRHELNKQDEELGNSVLEESEKPYQLICTEKDIQKHPNSETSISWVNILEIQQNI